MDIEESVRKRAQKIIDGYAKYDEKVEKKLRNYIQQCKEVHNEKKLLKKDIKLLEQCVEYLYDNSTVDDVAFLATIYLEEDKDKEALKLVNWNRTINERKKEDKQVLLEMYYEIKRYINIKKALYRDDKVEKNAWKSLGITETDYIKLKSKTKFKFSILKCCEQLLENKREEAISKKQSTESPKIKKLGEVREKAVRDKDKKEKDKQEEAKIIELHIAKVSQRKIARAIGKSQGTVSRKIKKLIAEGKIPDSDKNREEKDKQEEATIIELYSAGVSQIKIAEEIKKNQSMVSKRIKKLIEEGKIPNRNNEEAKIIELYNDGVLQKEIAKKIGKSTATVSKRIQKLREEGKTSDRDKDREEKYKQEEAKIIELYNAGKSQRKIAKAIGKDQKTVSRRIKKLIEEGKISDRDKDRQEKDKQEEAKIIELYNAGKSQKKIAEEIGKNQATVSRRIQKLIAEGKIPDRNKQEEAKIIELYSAYKSYKDIAKAIGKNKKTVSLEIKKLKKAGKIPDRDKDRKEKDKQEKAKILELYRLYYANKSYKEIADAIGKSEKTVSEIIKKLREYYRIIDRGKEEDKIIELYYARVSQREIAKAIGNSPATLALKIRKLREEGKLLYNDKEQSKESNNLEGSKEKNTEKDEKSTNIDKTDNEMDSYINDVEKIIDLLKKDMVPTYVQMQSIDETIQKNAIQRMDSIEILIDDLRKCMDYINGDNKNKKAKAEEFIKRICYKYRALDEEKKQIEQTKKMQLGGR